MKIPHQHSKYEQGQSLIELGFSITILLLILVGVMELGTLFFQYIAMRDAAEEGAVYTSIYPTACEQSIERIKKNLFNVDPSEVEVTVQVNGVQCNLATATDACASKEVKVSVHQPNYEIMMPFMGTILGRQTLDINATVTSTIIRPPCN